MFKGRLKMFKRTLIAFLCLCMLTESISLSVSATEMPTVIDVDSYDDSMPSNECDEITEETDDEITKETGLLVEESEEEEAFGEEEDSNLLVEEESIILDPQNEMFSKSNSITVCFDGNAEAVTDIPSDISASNEETIIIPNIEPKRDGATFLGWCDELNGYGNYYEPGTELKIKRDLYLYAIWEEEASIEYISSSYNSDGEETLSDEEEYSEVQLGASVIPANLSNIDSKLTYFGQFTLLSCTRSSITNMVRRRVYMERRNSDWESVYAKYDYDAKKMSFEKDIEYTLICDGKGTIKNGPKDYITRMLNEHPEGVVLRLSNNGNSHAVLLVGIEGDVLYAIDPVNVNDTKSSDKKIPEPNENKTMNIDKCYLITAGKYTKSINEWQTAISQSNIVEVYYLDSKDYKPICDHSCGYGSDGLCYNCKTMLPIKTEDYGARGWYEILKGSIDLKESPYKGAKSVLNYCSNDLTKGKLVTVEKAVQNGWYDGKNTTAHKWYLVDYYGQKGYVFQDNLKRVGDWAQPTPTATGSITATKTSVEKGKGIPFDGTITPQNGSITKVDVCFYNTQTGQEIDRKTTSIKNTSSTIKIKNGTIDSNLYVNSLNPGIYKARVYVYLNNGTNKLFESNSFEVRGASASSKPVTVAEPSLSNAPVSSGIGYVEYTLTESTQGASIFYKVGNGAYVQGGSLVNLTLRESTVISAYAKIGSTTSSTKTWSVTVPKLSAPTISYDENSEGSTVVIYSNNNGSTTYYRINGGGWNVYTGPFNVSSGCSISAKAECKGCITSSENTMNVPVSTPNTPYIYLETSKDIAYGDAVSFHWANDRKAKEYQITISKDGSDWRKDLTSVPQYSFIADEIGNYSIEIVAKNKIGYSAKSNVITIEAHRDMVVNFEDYDETLVSSQTVKYGRNASKPATPSRRGYTFSGWNGSYERVISDTTITAEYEINVYEVKFYDVDDTYIGTQNVIFDTAINEGEFKEKVTLKNSGRVFAGWNIFYAREDDSYLDLQHIDSDMKLRASTTWANENLPVVIESLSAKINYGQVSGVFNGYDVDCSFSTTDNKDIRAKVIITLLTDVGDGTYKMSDAKVETVHFTADSSHFSLPTTTIMCNGLQKADKVEVSVMSIEGSDRTGGLIAESKSCVISEQASKFWSEWMTESELQQKGHSTSEAGLETKKQYRERTNTKDITGYQSSSTAPAGYPNLYSDDSYWGNWVSNGTTPVYASSTRQVQTGYQTISQGYNQYRYGRWQKSDNSWNSFCKYCVGTHTGTYNLQYTDWSTTHYDPIKAWDWGKCSNLSHEHVGAVRSGSTDCWTEYKINNTYYYWEESRYIDTSYNVTTYQYRDYVGRYRFYRWNEGAWSAWQDGLLTDSNTADRSYEVQDRTLYRYVIYDASQLQTNRTGEIRSVAGSLNNSGLAGRKATILVYRSLNSDPTESQLEYVGQTSLGADGEYNFSFVTKQEPSPETEDFIVALGVEGSDNIVNIDTIRYDRPSYSVVFEVDGETVSEQMVSEGQSAVIPETPQKEGYVFKGWNRNTTNVDRDIVAVAQFVPEQVCVAFVDYLNQNTSIVRMDVGTMLVIPNDLIEVEHEGYTFEGWNIPQGNITEDTIVSAKWKPNTYNVYFWDNEGKIISEQEVAYGQAASAPKMTSIPNNMNFLGWSVDTEWWNVKEDTNVYPIVVDDKAAIAPKYTIVTDESSGEEYVQIIGNEGEEIYYTIDGSEPDVSNLNIDNSSDDNFGGEGLFGECQLMDDIDDDFYDEEIGVTYVYSQPIKVENNTYIRAISSRGNTNISPVSDYLYENSCEREESIYWGSVIDFDTKYINVSDGDIITIDVGIDEVPDLMGAMIKIKYDASVMCPIFDLDINDYRIASGELIDGNGTFTLITDDIADGELYVCWVGNEPTIGDGSLFKLRMIVNESSEKVNYPITIGYAVDHNYSSLDEPVDMSAITYSTIYKGEETEGEDVSVVEESSVEDGGLTIDPIPNQVYTGTAIKPNITIREGRRVLISGKDYSVSYKNNTNVAGINDDKAPTVIVKGKGNYEDDFELYFEITPADISGAAFTHDEMLVKKYNGKVQNVVPSIKFDNKKLSANSDFVYTILRDGVETQPISVGKYDIVVEGCGNYKGQLTIPYYISANDSLEKAKISKISDYQYCGRAIEPEVTVTLGKNILVRDKDYSVSYTDNLFAGKATVTVTGIGEYSGKKSSTFNITGIPISKTSIQGINNSSFTGRNITPKPEVMFYGDKLNEGVDYYVTYKNNKNAGKASVIITGIGRYSGSVTKTFTINPIDLTQSADVIVGLTDIKGNVVDAEHPLEFSSNNVLCVSVVDRSASYVLNNGVDFKLKYSNNSNVTIGKNKKAVVTITGMRNYKGSISQEFDISSGDINDTKVVVTDVAFVNKVNAYKVTPVIKDGRGKQLSAGKDYEKSFTYLYADDTILVNGEKRFANSEVQSKDIAPAGTKIKLVITGKGNYAGTSKTVEYNITKYSLKGAKIVSKDKIYTGQKITLDPENDEIRVVVNGKRLTYGIDYIIESYENNINRGNAVITIKGIGNYGGQVSSTFKIGTKKILWWIL